MSKKTKLNKNRFDKYIPLFSDKPDDKRVRLFVHELETMAHNYGRVRTGRPENVIVDNVFEENWVFKPDIYTAGMKNSNYKATVKPPNTNLGIILKPAGYPATPGLIPMINDNSMNPQFLTFILSVCKFFNSGIVEITIDSTNTKNERSKISFDDFKKNILNLTDPKDNSTDYFVKKLLTLLNITVSDTKGGGAVFTNLLLFGDFKRISSIRIPAFKNLVSNICKSTESDANPARALTARAAATIATDRLTLINGIEEVPNLNDATAGGEVTLNLFTISSHNNLILNLLSYILNIPGNLMNKIILYWIGNGQNQSNLYPNKLTLNHGANFSTDIDTIIAGIDRLIDDFLTNINNRHIIKPILLKKIIDNLKKLVVTDLNGAAKTICLTTLSEIFFGYDTTPANAGYVRDNNIYKVITANVGVLKHTERINAGGGAGADWGPPTAAGAPHIGSAPIGINRDVDSQYILVDNFVINILELLVLSLDEIIFDRGQLHFDYNLTKHAVLQLIDHEIEGQPIEPDEDDEFFNKPDDEFLGEEKVKYFRNEDGNLCIKKDGNLVEVHRDSEYYVQLLTKNMEEDNSCNVVGLKQNDDNKERCSDYLLECIKGNSEGIEKCKNFLMDENFWPKSKKEVNNMLPYLIVQSLDSLGFEKINYTLNNLVLVRYESLKKWFERLKTTVTAQEYESIYNNDNLKYYLTLLTQKVFNNPIILNPSYVVEEENVEMKVKSRDRSGILNRLIKNLQDQLWGNKNFRVNLRSKLNQLVGGDPFNLSEYEQYESQTKAYLKNFSFVAPILTDHFLNLKLELKQKNKAIAKSSLQKIEKLISGIDFYEKQAVKIIGILRKYVRSLDLTKDRTPEKELTLTKIDKKISHMTKKRFEKAINIKDIFGTIENIIIGNQFPDEEMEDEKPEQPSKDLKTFYKGL